MRIKKFNIFLSMAGAFIAWCLVGTLPALADITVTLDQPVHFTNAEGSDVVLEPGSYTVNAAEEWLRVTPSTGQAADALLLEAQTASHEESLTEPLAVSAQGEPPDVFHLALLLPGGKRIEAIGTYSGVRSRATISSLTLQRLRALTAARQGRASSSPEFVTPTFGGSGGNQSYNLDCGPGAIMVGVLGKSGGWIDAIGVICQQVNSNGQLGAEFTTRTVGGTGGAAGSDRCSSGSVVGSFFAESGSFVEGIVMRCVRWDQNNKRPTNDETEILGFGHRSVGFLGFTQNPINPRNEGFNCPFPKIGKALRGKHGIYIDSMRFVCDDWDK